MSGQEFAAFFAIAQAAPGPNFMISTLVGWKAAGLAGAIVATLAMSVPSCLLAFWAAKAWDRYREARWRIALAAALAPVSVGLVAASAWLLAGAADRTLPLAAVTGATAIAAGLTRINPLWFLAAAAVLGLAGIVR
jgi:chromate transporter